MPSINVQELFEKFMQDPEYIGKEELALAEAKQRAIQSMNNHKALSMAKMDSPLDTLVEYLQKGQDDYFQQDEHASQMSHIVSHEVKEPTHEEILGQFKNELIEMANSAVKNSPDPWGEILRDPRAAFQESEPGKNDINLTENANFLGRASAGVGGIPIERDPDSPTPLARKIPIGREALTELFRRVKPNSEAANMLSEFQSAIDGFEANQQFNRQYKTSDDELPDEPEGISAHALFNKTQGGMFAPRVHEGTGDKFVVANPGEGETLIPKNWHNALKSVLDTSEDFNSPLYQGWGHDQVRQGTNPKASQLDDNGRAVAQAQSNVIGLVNILTGKNHSSPAEALNRLKDIRNNPEQFIRIDPNTDRPIYRTSFRNGVKEFLTNPVTPETQYEPTQGDHVRTHYETTRANHLEDIVNLTDNLGVRRTDFNHPRDFEEDPEGRGWKHEQPLSPLQQWQIKNAQHPTLSSEQRTVTYQTDDGEHKEDVSSDAGNELMSKIQQRYNREEHGTPAGLTALFNEVIAENGFTFPAVPPEVAEQEANFPTEYPVKDHTEQEAHDRRFPEYSQRGEIKETRLGELKDGQYNILPIGAERKADEEGQVTPDDILDNIMNATPETRAEVERDAQIRWSQMTLRDQEAFVARSMAYFQSTGQIDDPTTANLAGMSEGHQRLSGEGQGFETFGNRSDDEGDPTDPGGSGARRTDLVTLNPDWHKTGEFPWIFLGQDEVDEEAGKGIGGEKAGERQFPPTSRAASTHLPPSSNIYADDTVHPTTPKGFTGSPTGMNPDQAGIGTSLNRPRNHVSLGISDDSSLYEGENRVSLHNPDERIEYEKYREWMGELIKYGIPLEDLTHETPHGDLIWSKSTMLEGMREYGMMHHGQDDSERRFRSVNNRNATEQGVAPVFPTGGPKSTKGRNDNLKRIMTPEQAVNSANQEAVLKDMWTNLHGGKKRNETPYDRTPGKNEKFSEVTSSRTTGNRPSTDSSYVKVNSARYGIEDPVTKERPLLSAEQWAKRTPELSTKPTFKRSGKYVDSQGRMQSTGLGTYSDSKYLNHIIKMIADHKLERESFSDDADGIEAKRNRRHEMENEIRDGFNEYFINRKDVDYGDIAHYFATEYNVEVSHPKDLPMGRNLSVSKEEEDKFHESGVHNSTRYDPDISEEASRLREQEARSEGYRPTQARTASPPAGYTRNQEGRVVPSRVVSLAELRDRLQSGEATYGELEQAVSDVHNHIEEAETNGGDGVEEGVFEAVGSLENITAANPTASSDTPIPSESIETVSNVIDSIKPVWDRTAYDQRMTTPAMSKPEPENYKPDEVPTATPPAQRQYRRVPGTDQYRFPGGERDWGTPDTRTPVQRLTDATRGTTPRSAPSGDRTLGDWVREQQAAAPVDAPVDAPVEEAAGEPAGARGGATVKNFPKATGIQDAKEAELNGEGVNVLRKPRTDEHYGNPFSYEGASRAAKRDTEVLSTVEEATQAYDDWLHGRAYTNFKQEQRQWILNQVQNGALDNKQLLYYTDEHEKAGRDSHADVLARFVNDAKGIPDNEQPANVGEAAPIDTSDMSPSEAVQEINRTSPPARDIQYDKDTRRYIDKKTGEVIDDPSTLSARERRPGSLHGYTSHSGGANGADQAWDDVGQYFGVESKHYHVGDFDHSLTRTQVDEHNNTSEAEDRLVWYPPGHRHTHKISKETSEDIKSGLIDEQLKSIGDELESGTGQSWDEIAKKDNPDATYNLLRRNVEQVRMSDGVFAISKGIIDGKYADGGTGWAVEYAKRYGNTDGTDERDFIPIHVYDIKAGKWQTWNRETEQFEDTPTEDGIPELTPNFAGIGTRGWVKQEEFQKPPQDRNFYNTDIPDAAKTAMADVYRKAAGEPPRSTTGTYTPPTEQELLGQQPDSAAEDEPASSADAIQIEREDNMTPELARANPNKLYLFGDNEQDNDPTGARKLNADGTRRQGSQAAGQAWIRHEDNAHGIRTKGSPSQHWTAEDHDANIAKVDEDFKAAIERARAEGKSIVIPRDGFGTGRAELGERSPETLAHINKRIQELEEGNFSVADGTPAAEEQPAAETPAPSPTPSPTGTTGASQPFYDEEGYTPPSVHPVAAPVPQNIEDIRNSYKQRIEGFWEMVKAAPTDPRWYDGTFGRAIEGGDPAPHKADTRAQFRGRGWSRESNEGKLYGDLRTGQTIPKEQANANLRATHRNDLLNEARAKIQQHAQLLHDDSSGDANIANEETGEFLRPHLGEHIEHDPELTRTENWGEGGNPNDQDSEYENRALPPPVEGEDSGEPVSNEDEIADPTGEPTTSDPADWINSKDEIINKLGLPEDRREWTGEQIKQYASGLADLMKSRVKDEAGRKYIDWMAKNQGDLTVDPRGDHLKTVRSPDTPVQFSYGFPMKIEKMVDELSGERELSIGELGNWGNHNSIKWAFSPFGRWDAGTLEDAETGKNVKRSRSVDEYKPELLEGISKRDREQVEQLEALPYEDRTGADFESAREISNRALRNTSVGRVIHWGVTRDHRFINQARRKHTISQDQMNARHSDYADGVHSEINDLAAHMNSTGYHDGTASPEDKEHIDNKLMSLASEVSRSKVTDPQEALKILTTDKNHLGTKRSHHDAFSENGFTSDMHNELHGHQPHDGASDRAEQDESSDESFSAEIEGAEEDPEVKALPASPDEYTPTPEQEKQIALIQGRIDTKQKRLNNENIKFHEARDRVQELANNLNAKEANNEEILPSEKTQYEVAKRAAISANTRRKSIANEINTHIEEIDNQRKPATTTTTPPKEEPPKEEPPKEEPQPTEESEEEKTKKAQEALDLLARQGLISSSAHEKMSRQIKPQASPKESSFEPDSPLHPNNWRGMYEKEDENALEAALERLGKSDYNHESLEHWLGNPAGRKQIIAEANRHAGANLHTSNDQDTAKVRQDNIKEINRLRAKRNDLKPLDEETLGHSSFDVAAHLKTEQKADIKWENERSERESKNIIAQKPTSLQSRIDERLAVDPQADPNAQISPREATEQFRHVVGQAHQLSLIGGTFARGGDYEKHYAELDTLGNEALKHGADWERIRKEMADHTKDGVLQSSFGSPEHLADAKAYHDTRDAHTADYQSLFAPGSQKAVDAWNDSHYHPNARIMPTATQNEDGSFNIGKLSDGDVRRDKYDPISKKWSTTTSNIQDTLVANRHNGIRTDVNSAPHILGMSPEQREEHDSLHKEIQATGGANLPISPSQRARKTALTDSLIESGHITEDQRYTKDNPLNHPAFGADATDSHNTGITSGMTSETVPDGHHFVPGVGHVKTDAINTIQKTLKPGEAFYHPGDQKGGSLVSNPDGSDAQKGIMVDHNGVHAVGTIASEASHDSHGPITNQHIRETDLANGLHVATGNSNGITHKNVTEHDNGFHIKNVSQTLADSGSHFGTSPAAADHAPKPPEPSIASKAGGALGRFASKVGAAAKPAADTFARAYTAGDGMPASSVKQQTFKGVAQRGLSSLLGRVAGESSVAKITGMTPTQASQADTAFKAGQQPESLEKLIKFVKSEK